MNEIKKALRSVHDFLERWQELPRDDNEWQSLVTEANDRAAALGSLFAHDLFIAALEEIRRRDRARRKEGRL